MNTKFTKAGLLLAILVSSGAYAGNVGVSIQIGQPGFYGSLDIGNFQQPELIYSQPRIVEQVRVALPPLYLVVPSGHIKHWEKECRRYNACGRQVYFVQERWYNDVVVPRYREGQYREDQYRDDHRRHDRRDDDDNREHGRGNEGEHGHGYGHDHDR